VQIWLVTAYEAAEQRTEAIALCEQLKSHPDSETSKRARQLLYIMQAPQLKRPTEWLTQIPDLGQCQIMSPKLVSARAVGSNCSQQQRPEPSTIDLAQVNTRDNRFIWVALIALGLTLAGLFWLI
jgi:hypothetical protein